MKILKNILKTALAGMTAFAILCGIMLFYSFIPPRVDNSIGNTDYVYDFDSYWVRATEGISFGQVDANGFNNKNVVENPDIVVLGSSHAEAMNVFQDENMTSLLSEKLGGKYSVYNMSISGHTFFKVVQYLPETLSAFEKVPEYIIIETSTTVLSQQDVEMAVSGTVPKTKVNRGFIAELQKLPFLRQLYHQLDSGMLDMLLDKQKQNVGDASGDAEAVIVDSAPYETMFSYLQKLEQQFDTEIIIIYHPAETLGNDGSISFSNGEYTSVFCDFSENYGISFADMTELFEKMYYEEHTVPHGFSTGALGEGHINRYGHRAIADKLFEMINSFGEGE